MISTLELGSNEIIEFKYLKIFLYFWNIFLLLRQVYFPSHYVVKIFPLLKETKKERQSPIIPFKLIILSTGLTVLDLWFSCHGPLNFGIIMSWKITYFQKISTNFRNMGDFVVPWHLLVSFFPSYNGNVRSISLCSQFLA